MRPTSRAVLAISGVRRRASLDNASIATRMRSTHEMPDVRVLDCIMRGSA